MKGSNFRRRRFYIVEISPFIIVLVMIYIYFICYLLIDNSQKFFWNNWIQNLFSVVFIFAGTATVATELLIPSVPLATHQPHQTQSRGYHTFIPLSFFVWRLFGFPFLLFESTKFLLFVIKPFQPNVSFLFRYFYIYYNNLSYIKEKS